MTRTYNMKHHGTPEERFWKYTKIAKSPVLCWNWIGPKNHAGYGSMKINQKQIGAHRFSYKLHIGDIPIGLFVCHSCDNPSCVNPTHLWLGTPQENMTDKIKKGRTRSCHMYGETNPKSKLSVRDVEEIRKLYKTGSYTQRKLGKIYKMSHTAIGDILRHKSWVK